MKDSALIECGVIVSHGKAFLASNGNYNIQTDTRPTISEVGKIECINGEKRSLPFFQKKPYIVANDIISWFSYLLNRGATDINLLDITKDNLLQTPKFTAWALINGIDRIIEVSYQNKLELWLFSYSYFENGKTGTWLKYLWAMPIEKRFYSIKNDVLEANSGFLKALDDIILFCEEDKIYSNWKENYFIPTRNILINESYLSQVSDNDSSSPLLSGCHSSYSFRLIDAVNKGWVFGMMGWWNDNSLAHDPSNRFSEVTNNYYKALIASVCAAINDFSNHN